MIFDEILLYFLSKTWIFDEIICISLVNHGYLMNLGRTFFLIGHTCNILLLSTLAWSEWSFLGCFSVGWMLGFSWLDVGFELVGLECSGPD